jgi:hypothetical protein
LRATKELGKEFWVTSAREKLTSSRSKVYSVPPNRRCTKSQPWLWSRPIYVQTFVLHVPRQCNQPSHKRLPHIPRVLEENGLGVQPTFGTNDTQKWAPHHEMGTPPLAILSILPFAFPIASLPKLPNPTSSLLPIIPLCHNHRQLYK